MSWEQRNIDFCNAQANAQMAYIEAEREVVRLEAENAKLRELARDTCRMDETEAITYYDEYGHDAVTVHVMECSKCGRTYEHVNGSYEYCPRCGTRVEENH